MRESMSAEREKMLRILDANANRAREGLRVVEDYCRFVLDDADLSGRLKSMRHDITQQVSAITVPAEFLQARDSESDVGASGSESVGHDGIQPAQVVLANIKRAEEALRCLEEYAKVLDAAVSDGFKQIRFELYTLEKRLLPLLNER
jgi:thiamine-phosphate pyrophosphorylase